MVPEIDKTEGSFRETWSLMESSKVVAAMKWVNVTTGAGLTLVTVISIENILQRKRTCRCL